MYSPIYYLSWILYETLRKRFASKFIAFRRYLVNYSAFVALKMWQFEIYRHFTINFALNGLNWRGLGRDWFKRHDQNKQKLNNQTKTCLLQFRYVPFRWPSTILTPHRFHGDLFQLISGVHYKRIDMPMQTWIEYQKLAFSDWISGESNKLYLSFYAWVA